MVTLRTPIMPYSVCHFRLRRPGVAIERLGMYGNLSGCVGDLREVWRPWLGRPRNSASEALT